MGNGRHQPGRGLFAGLFIVALGIVFLLDQEGIVSADYMFHFFWPAIFIFFGLEAASCRTNAARRNLGLVITGIGVLMLLSTLNLVRFRIGFELIWPVALICLGVWVILRALTHAGTAGGGFAFLGSWAEHLNQWRGSDSMDSQFENLSVFAGVKRRITSKNFRGGNVLAIFGGFQIDLTHADIEGDSAVITANACMGGGEIRVPETWVVDIQGVPILGGFVDETHQIPPTDPAKTKRLVVKGIALMGGVAIKN
jgi:hypothetical protein